MINFKEWNSSVNNLYVSENNCIYLEYSFCTLKSGENSSMWEDYLVQPFVVATMIMCHLISKIWQLFWTFDIVW
jgi:hypothetical protein